MRTLDPEEMLSASSAVSEEQRVSFVFGMMRSLRWPPSASGELRDHWGLSIPEMEAIIAEARGMMRGVMSEDREEIRAIILQQFQFLAEEAMRKKKHFLVTTGTGQDKESHIESVEDPDIKGASAALTSVADIFGLKKGSEKTPEEKTTEELVKKLLEKQGSVMAVLTEGKDNGNQAKATVSAEALPARRQRNARGQPDSSGDEDGF
jgi:hypothetical protein